MFLFGKIVPSKLIFTISGGGGRHLTDLDILGILAWMGLSYWNSWRESQAMAGIFSKSKTLSPTRNLFLLIQISDTIIAKRSTCFLSCWASWMTSIKPETDLVAFIGFTNCTCHTETKDGQDERAWKVSSRPDLQFGQLASNINFLRNKLSLVGSESDPTRYSRERTLFGTWRCHILFETPFITSMSDAPGSTNSSPFMSSLYPVLTKYTPS